MFTGGLNWLIWWRWTQQVKPTNSDVCLLKTNLLSKRNSATQTFVNMFCVRDMVWCTWWAGILLKITVWSNKAKDSLSSVSAFYAKNFCDKAFGITLPTQTRIVKVRLRSRHVIIFKPTYIQPFYLHMTCFSIRTMQVIFLKILSSSAAIVATFMTLSTLLMVNLLNSSLHQHTNHDSNYISTSSRRIKTIPFVEEHTQNAFDALTVVVWNPQNYKEAFTPSPSCKPDLPLLILVTSAPEHYERRQAIRETWGKDWADPIKTEWRTIFMVGRTASTSRQILIEKEIGEHGDILMGNYIDSYRNLTLKVQHGMSWALENCRPQYLLKTDDDCFVNSKLFTKFLTTQNTKRTGLYAGYSLKKLDVVRDKKSKWYVSRESYQPSQFPNYASGVGYVISLDVLQSIVTTAKFIIPFAAEDAYTGLLAESADIPLLDSARFALNNVNWRLCNYLYLLVIHGVRPDQQVLGLRYSVECHSRCNNQPEAADWN